MTNPAYHNQFALNVVSLCLLRNAYLDWLMGHERYETPVVVQFAKGPLARPLDRFGVLIAWVPDIASVDKDAPKQCEEFAAGYGMPFYFAYVIGDGDLIVTDADLEKRMVYSKEQLQVTTFDAL